MVGILAKYKCFTLVQHLHNNHTRCQREKVPKERYSELLYDLCKCGSLVNYKKSSCKHCGTQHLRKSPKDLSLQRKSEFQKNNIIMENDNLPSLESILSASVRIYSHVPGYCQRLWKESLSTCLSSVQYNKDLTSWKKLAMLSKCLF
jgi:hypothetical protein